MDVFKDHDDRVRQIADQIKNYALSGKKSGVCFYHGNSTTTRPEKQNDAVIDISGLRQVLEVNVEKSYAIVEPNVSMEELCRATLKYGLLPQVVMEFPAITCGGGVNGAALESSSYKHGQFNDTCMEYEIVLGNGDVVKATPEENRDLFYGISGSYGSIGLLTMMKINLVPATRYVEVTYYPTDAFISTLERLKEKLTDADIDYLDGILFSAHLGVVTTGRRVNEGSLPIRTYRKARDPWFYERVQEAALENILVQELIPILDYIFRYDRGAFWMGNFGFSLLGIPKNTFTKKLFDPVAKAKKLFEGLSTLNMSQSFFAQDFYVPFEKSLEFFNYNERTIQIYPLWLCPIRSANDRQILSPHFIGSPMLLDIGIWGQSETYLSDPVGVNKKFEELIRSIDGRKMLYAHAYYSESEFWNIYDIEWYRQLRHKYFADDVFPDVWKKTYVQGQMTPRKWLGLFRFFIVHPLKRFFSGR